MCFEPPGETEPGFLDAPGGKFISSTLKKNESWAKLEKSAHSVGLYCYAHLFHFSPHFSLDQVSSVRGSLQGFCSTTHASASRSTRCTCTHNRARKWGTLRVSLLAALKRKHILTIETPCVSPGRRRNENEKNLWPIWAALIACEIDVGEACNGATGPCSPRTRGGFSNASRKGAKVPLVQPLLQQLRS